MQKWWLVILAGLGVVFVWFWPQLRGLRPILSSSTETDISQLLAPTASVSPENQSDFPLTLPNQIAISLFADQISGPRVLVEDPQGNIVVSLTQAGEVVVLPDKNQDGQADTKITLLRGLNRPHGLALRCSENSASELETTPCQLYIAETNQLSAYTYNPETIEISNKRPLLDLPAGGGHYTRTLLFQPPPSDHKLLISVGSSCNVCEEANAQRASVLVYNTQTDQLESYATGLRNAVFMTNHPNTKQTWVTEMGRDWLGDNLPPDEINILKSGQHYGWPYCYGEQVPDQDFLPKTDKTASFCSTTEPALITIPAHSAPLGLAFFPDTGWPEEYQTDLLVAYHGSWNRTVPTGYKLVRFRLDEHGNYQGREDFITGWLTNDDQALGRPAGIVALSDGSMLVSDDKADVIYRIQYRQ